MSKKCAKCEKTVYPTEEFRCLDKTWHKGCFKCWECGMTLGMKNYKGYDKKPYCSAHYPKLGFTAAADTPEMARLAQNTKLQSQVNYHAEFEKSIKGHKVSVTDEPELNRLKKNQQITSQIEYSGLKDKHAEMESRRELGQGDNPRRPSASAAVAAAPSYGDSPASARNQSHSTAYNSQGGKVEQPAAGGRVGSITDYDPMSDNWGSLQAGYKPPNAATSRQDWEETVSVPPQQQQQQQQPGFGGKGKKKGFGMQQQQPQQPIQQQPEPEPQKSAVSKFGPRFGKKQQQQMQQQQEINVQMQQQIQQQQEQEQQLLMQQQQQQQQQQSKFGPKFGGQGASKFGSKFGKTKQQQEQERIQQQQQLLLEQQQKEQELLLQQQQLEEQQKQQQKQKKFGQTFGGQQVGKFGSKFGSSKQQQQQQQEAEQQAAFGKQQQQQARLQQQQLEQQAKQQQQAQVAGNPFQQKFNKNQQMFGRE